MFNKKLYFKNNYQRDLFIQSRLERIKYIDNKLEKLLNEKQSLLNDINQVKSNDYNLCNELINKN